MVRSEVTAAIPRQLVLGLGLALLLGAAGCGVDWPEQFPNAKYSRRQLEGQTAPQVRARFPKVVADTLRDELAKQFGTPANPHWPEVLQYESVPEGERLAIDARQRDLRAGSRLYQQHCLHCHGMAGGGDGPSGITLHPRPRNLRLGVFKWKSTAVNDKPLREDLYRTLDEGLPGSQMASYRTLADVEKRQLVEYILFLAARGEVEFGVQRELDLIREEEFERMQAWLNGDPAETGLRQAVADFASESLESVMEAWAAPQPIDAPEGWLDLSPQSPEYAASVRRGRALYLGAGGCTACHGTDGRARPEAIDPAKLATLLDKTGEQIYPRNLTLGFYRGGRRPVDLYRRMHQGIAPNLMPGQGAQLKPEELWDLVRFVRTLPYQPELLAQPVWTASDTAVRQGGHSGTSSNSLATHAAGAAP